MRTHGLPLCLFALSAACADELIAPIEGSVEVEVRNVRAETNSIS